MCSVHHGQWHAEQHGTAVCWRWRALGTAVPDTVTQCMLCTCCHHDHRISQNDPVWLIALEPVFNHLCAKVRDVKHVRKASFMRSQGWDVRIIEFKSLLCVLFQHSDTFSNSTTLLIRKYIEQRLKHEVSDISYWDHKKDAFSDSFDIRHHFWSLYATSQRCLKSSCFPHCFSNAFSSCLPHCFF